MAGGEARRRSKADLAVGLAPLAIPLLILAPLPGLVLDALFAASLGAATLLAVTTVRARSRGGVAALPTALLLATALRLVVALAAVRSLLARGAAGEMVAAAGRAAGDAATGLALYATLAAAQHLVVTRGAERAAEVAARFALDALPGRQMSVDAALRAGAIDPSAAQRDRAQIEADGALHAAMDGAARFVRGEAIASALLVGAALLGGTLVAALRDGASLSSALSRQGTLAAGIGILTQVPSFVCALALGLAVTRGDAAGSLGSSLAETFLRDPRTLVAVGAGVALLGLAPGVPLLPTVLAGAAIAALGWPRGARVASRARIALVAAPGELDAAQAQVAAMRSELTMSLGCAVPEVAVTAGPSRAVSLDGVVAARAEDLAALMTATRALVASRPSRWFGVEEARAWLDAIAADAPTLVAAVVPRVVALPGLTAILAALLDGGAPVAPARTLLGALAVATHTSPRGLALAARAAMRDAVAARWAPSGSLRVVEVSDLLSDLVRDAAARAPADVAFAPGPALLRDLRAALDALPDDAPSVVATAARSRQALEDALRAAGDERAVLSWEELTGVAVERAATLGPQ